MSLKVFQTDLLKYVSCYLLRSSEQLSINFIIFLLKVILILVNHFSLT